MNNGGRLFGIGVGPGDPGLVTLNAIAALKAADSVAHFAKAGNASNARAIAACHFKDGVEELPLLYPVTTEIPASFSPTTSHSPVWIPARTSRSSCLARLTIARAHAIARAGPSKRQKKPSPAESISSPRKRARSRRTSS